MAHNLINQPIAIERRGREREEEGER